MVCVFFSLEVLIFNGVDVQLRVHSPLSLGTFACTLSAAFQPSPG